MPTRAIQLTLKRSKPAQAPLEALAYSVCNSRGDILPHALLCETIKRVGWAETATKALQDDAGTPPPELAYAVLSYIRANREAFDAVNDEYFMGVL